ncbi:MAG: NAD-dependent epimerase/dehydratase family protein [Polyangiaceae bacterium]
MKVLVTGGAGFIGSRLTMALADAGHRVVVADNLVATGSLRLLEDHASRIEFHHADIQNPADFRDLGGDFDVVYHLAASFANELSIEDPQLDFGTNVLGTQNVLDFARRAGCGLFVYTGSSSSYGAVRVPFEEDGPLEPTTPYARTKFEAEERVRASGLRHVTFRLFNVYGPGDYPGAYRNAIPNMFATAREHGKVRIFGAEATRDFTFVDDVVDILLSAERGVGGVFNLGTGREVRIASLARFILKLSGLDSHNIRIEMPRSWDNVTRRVASVDRLRACFGRVPSTHLEFGLAATAEWLERTGHLPTRTPELGFGVPAE